MKNREKGIFISKTGRLNEIPKEDIIWNEIKNYLERKSSLVFIRKNQNGNSYSDDVFGLILNPEEESFLCAAYEERGFINSNCFTRWNNYSTKALCHSTYEINKEKLSEEISRLYKIADKAPFFYVRVNSSSNDYQIHCFYSSENFYTLKEVQKEIRLETNNLNEYFYQDEAARQIFATLDQLEIPEEK